MGDHQGAHVDAGAVDAVPIAPVAEVHRHRPDTEQPHVEIVAAHLGDPGGGRQKGHHRRAGQGENH
ncbi:MAG TPA: hypothetical protein DFK55_11725 [Alcanivorax sp.]|nr:hypothetical protein [Alcanivorax sp.]